MGLLTREAILSAKDLPCEQVDVPEWGGAILMRGLTAKARDEWEMSLYWMRENDGHPDPSSVDIRARLVELCVVDESGQQIFAAGELRERNAVVISRLFAIAQRLSGMGEGAVTELGKG